MLNIKLHSSVKRNSNLKTYNHYHGDDHDDDDNYDNENDNNNNNNNDNNNNNNNSGFNSCVMNYSLADLIM